MITIENCNVTLYQNGKIAFVNLPPNPEYETLMRLGRGQPCHDKHIIALQYMLQGITFFLER